MCEQQLYNKADLDRHMKVGDASGPLADSGFKGHPVCRFCKCRFYDNNELFKHMESAHEQCFICRRVQPDKYVYYRDYAELEGGWRQQGAAARWQHGLMAGSLMSCSMAAVWQHVQGWRWRATLCILSLLMCGVFARPAACQSIRGHLGTLPCHPRALYLSDLAQPLHVQRMPHPPRAGRPTHRPLPSALCPQSTSRRGTTRAPTRAAWSRSSSCSRRRWS